MSDREGRSVKDRVWRKSRLEVHPRMFIALCLILKNIVHGVREQFLKPDFEPWWRSKETILHC